jgi:hypothetical protein
LLRFREPRQRPRRDALEDVSQRRERELCLGFDRPADQHPVGPLSGGHGRVLPERRLADAHFTLDPESGGTLRNGIEEPL